MLTDTIILWSLNIMGAFYREEAQAWLADISDSKVGINPDAPQFTP